MMEVNLLLFMLPLHTFAYHASWETGARQLTWDQAKDYCTKRGQRMVSLDTTEKARQFLDVLASSGKPYFWTGGRLENNARVLIWPNGVKEDVRRGRFPWSTSGLHGPQPDGGGTDECVAALDISFYKDGAKLHDVGCSHKKPVICE